MRDKMREYGQFRKSLEIDKKGHNTCSMINDMPDFDLQLKPRKKKRF